MSNLTLVQDSLLDERLVREKDFSLPGARLDALSQRIQSIKTDLDGKQKITDPIDWKDIKNKGFAWNELPGVPYASRPQYGIVMTDDDIFQPLRQEDHFIAATCKAVSKVPVGSEGIVPTTRTINGKPLSDDIWINAEDVGSYPKEYMLDALKSLDATYQLYVPDSTTINGYPLTGDVWLKSFEVGVMTKEDWQNEYNKRLQEIWDRGGMLGYRGNRNYDVNVFAPIGIDGPTYNSSPRGLQIQPKGAFAYGSEGMANNYDEFVVEAQIPGSPNLAKDFRAYQQVPFSQGVPVTRGPWKESIAAIKLSIDRWHALSQEPDLVDMSKFHLNGVKLTSVYIPTPLGDNRGIGIGSNNRFCWRVTNNANFILSMGGMNINSAGKYMKTIGASNLPRHSTGGLSDITCDVKFTNGIAGSSQGYKRLGATDNGWSLVTDFGRFIR